MKEHQSTQKHADADAREIEEIKGIGTRGGKTKNPSYPSRSDGRYGGGRRRRDDLDRGLSRGERRSGRGERLGRSRRDGGGLRRLLCRGQSRRLSRLGRGAGALVGGDLGAQLLLLAVREGEKSEESNRE